MIPCPWNQIRGPPLALSWCLESNGVNGSSIRATVLILWHVESHLLQAFRDTCWIPTRGIEWKPCIKKGFWWVIQACLGIYYVGTLATPSWSTNMWIWSLCAEIGHSLTEQNPSFQNWPKKWSLVHGPRLEGLLYHYPYVLNPTEPMVHWSEKQSSFYGMLNPTSYRLSGTPIESLPREYNGNRASKMDFGGSWKCVYSCSMWEC